MIRKATIADAVAEVYIESRKQHVAFAKLTHAEVETRSWICQQLIPGGNVLVLERDKRISALMAISATEEGSWIDQLYVQHDLIGQGLGRSLLEYAKEVLDPPIYLYTSQQNERARRFNERNGFRILRFSDGSRNEEHCPDILYCLEKIGVLNGRIQKARGGIHRRKKADPRERKPKNSL